jgi:hypothetical protein
MRARGGAGGIQKNNFSIFHSLQLLREHIYLLQIEKESLQCSQSSEADIWGDKEVEANCVRYERTAFDDRKAFTLEICSEWLLLLLPTAPMP